MGIALTTFAILPMVLFVIGMYSLLEKWRSNKDIRKLKRKLKKGQYLTPSGKVVSKCFNREG